MEVDQYIAAGDKTRKRALPDNAEDEEITNRPTAPPAFDLYRMRQQRRHVAASWTVATFWDIGTVKWRHDDFMITSWWRDITVPEILEL